MTQIPERVAALREQMKRHGMSAYIVPSSDPHLSEYPADRWKSREWISGFTGSAGTVVVTPDKAGLWTDSRYFLQADIQLKGSGIELYKSSLAETPTIAEFLSEELKSGETAGLDGNTYSAADRRALEKALLKKGIKLETGYDLIGNIWNDRPAVPKNKLFEMPVELSGRSTRDKIKDINEKLGKAGADCLILGALDETAWTFNIRGTDVTYNPVAVCYGFISDNESILFIDPEKVPAEAALRLKDEGVSIKNYSEIENYLSSLPSTTTIFADPARTNAALYNAIPEGCEIIEGITPANHLKSVKNETEIKGFRNALVKDGIALTKLYMWLEQQMKDGEHVTEISAGEKLASLRAEQPLYLMDSFATISGYGPHGAIVHYSATPETDSELKPESLFLMDSGAQFMDGTTDITRTIALGEPTERMRNDFTRALKGMIGIATCRFPAGIRGCLIDVLARKSLWDAGINYLHGTCHGIGHCLNVHEGPQSIRMEENPVPLEAGMVMSDEPAMYRTGEYGIRTENVNLIKEDIETEYGRFLTFETLTLCYIDTRLLDLSILTDAELDWINNYHRKVYDKLSPHLNNDEKEWLKEKTAEVEKV